jgi:rRNA maturation protein Rpf1
MIRGRISSFIFLNLIFYFILSSCSTTRQIRDLYNIRSGEEPIIQHSDDDKEFQKILLKALEVEYIQNFS